MNCLSNTGVFTPIKKKNESLARLVMNNIKDALIKGQLKPGDKLPSIADMATEMNVGVSSVREAIKMLEALCVVESHHGGRVEISSELKEDSINPLTFQLMILPKNSEDLVAFREMFETAFSFMAIDNATSEDLERIRVIVQTQIDKEKVRKLDTDDEMEFHRAVLNSTHNAYIIKIGETLLELFLATIKSKWLFMPDYDVIGVTESHVATYEAIRDKDKRKLRNTLDAVFKGWRIKFFNEAQNN